MINILPSSKCSILQLQKYPVQVISILKMEHSASVKQQLECYLWDTFKSGVRITP